MSVWLHTLRQSRVVRLGLLLLCSAAPAAAQSTEPYRGPIIDVHLHAHTRQSLAQPMPNPATGEMPPKSPEELLNDTGDGQKDGGRG